MKTKLLFLAITCVGFYVTAQNTHPTAKVNSMENYTIIQKPSITILGIECKTSNAPEAGPRDIPLHWEKFYKENIISKIPNKASNEVIGLYCDYEKDHTKPYSFVIGCPVSSCDTIPDGMVVKILPATSYALFSATGKHPESLIKTWGNIWQTDLKRTFTGDFEVYGEKFSSKSPQEVEVFIAITK